MTAAITQYAFDLQLQVAMLGCFSLTPADGDGRSGRREAVAMIPFPFAQAHADGDAVRKQIRERIVYRYRTDMRRIRSIA